MNIYDIPITLINGEVINLKKFEGKKILIVNTASKCEFTNQYSALQELYQEYSDSLVLLGVPCNQFSKQEPGTLEEIESFCQTNFGITFLLTQKLKVKGPNQHPLYEWLTSKELNGVKSSVVKWNFQKYLLDEHGNFVDCFYSITTPNGRRITRHLE